jgi:hypothetical protein
MAQCDQIVLGVGTAQAPSPDVVNMQICPHAANLASPVVALENSTVKLFVRGAIKAESSRHRADYRSL